MIITVAEFSVRKSRGMSAKPGNTMHPNSIMRQLASYFVEEHVCAPPDARSAWMPVASATCAGHIGIYACPECGQHLARVSTASAARHPVLFKSANAIGRPRAAA